MSSNLETDRVVTNRDLSNFSPLHNFKGTGELSDLKWHGVGDYTLWHAGIPIDFRVKGKPGLPLLVCFHGAILDSVTLPWLVGAGVTRELNCSVLQISDPSLYLDPDLKLAWYAGNSFQPDLQNVLLELVRQVSTGLEATEVVFFGGSGGGFASLQLAGRWGKGGTAVAFNPQTHIQRYNPTAVDMYRQTAWGGRISDEIESHLADSVRSGLIPERVLYLQNSQDYWHIKVQMPDYLEALQQHSDSQEHMFLFEDWGPGHVGPSKERLTDILNLVITGAVPFDYIRKGFRPISMVNVRDTVKGLMSPYGLERKVTERPPVVSRGSSTTVRPSTISREDYLEHFDIPGASGIEVKSIRSGAAEIKFSTGASVSVNEGVLETSDFWTQSFESQQDNNRLWLRSCTFAAEIARRGDVNLALTALESYRNFLNENELHYIKLRMNSFDHCLALNLRVCAWMIKVLDLDLEQRKIVDDLLMDVLELVKSFDFFLPNNHGLMLALGILHVDAVCAVPIPAELDRRRICTFLCGIYEDVVSDNGYVRENTVAYQYYWTGWSREVADTFGYLIQDLPLAIYFESKRLRIEQACGLMAVSESVSLPLGDGNMNLTAVSPPRGGLLDSASDGLLIDNDGSGNVLAFKCGGASVVHKHADDLSLCWFVDGRMVLADAGFNSYDPSDPISACATSQRGHSALVLPEYDQTPAQQLFPWASPNEHSSGVMTLSERTEGGFVAHGSQFIRDRYILRRRVRYERGGLTLKIDDFAESFSDGFAENPVARFLIPADFAVCASSKHGLQFRSNDLTLDFSSSASSFDLKKGSKSTAAPFGIYLPSPGVVKPAWVLEFPLNPYGGSDMMRVSVDLTVFQS